MGITTDNALNNITFIDSLTTWTEEQLISFDKDENHIRCFAHSINISVQESLNFLKDELKQVKILLF